MSLYVDTLAECLLRVETALQNKPPYVLPLLLERAEILLRIANDDE